jgi:hypothetical protein
MASCCKQEQTALVVLDEIQTPQMVCAMKLRVYSADIGGSQTTAERPLPRHAWDGSTPWTVKCPSLYTLPVGTFFASAFDLCLLWYPTQRKQTSSEEVKPDSLLLTRLLHSQESMGLCIYFIPSEKVILIQKNDCKRTTVCRINYHLDRQVRFFCVHFAQLETEWQSVYK